MRHPRLILWIFILLTAINVTVFFFRDHFQYKPYAGYDKLYQPCDPACREKWREYVIDFPEQELASAKKITDSLVAKDILTIQKVLHLGQFLARRYHHRLGTPTHELLAASPFQQFLKLEKEDSLQLWCDNFALIFSWFCWSQDIVCRNIEIANPGDHHVLNECYLPESKQWVVVDLTNNILVFQQKNYLNYADVKQAARQDHVLSALRVSGDSISKVDIAANSGFLHAYYASAHPAFFYHSVNYFRVYELDHKIKTYLLPVSWYDLFDENGGNNVNFYIKLLLIVLWIASFFVFLGSRKKIKS